MDIPINLRLSLKAGCVYYFVDRGTTSSEPHYFVVLNKDPVRSKVLILAIVTSNIARGLANFQLSWIACVDLLFVEFVGCTTSRPSTLLRCLHCLNWANWPRTREG